MNNLELNRYLDIMHPNAKGQKIVFKLLTIFFVVASFDTKDSLRKKKPRKTLPRKGLCADLYKAG